MTRGKPAGHTLAGSTDFATLQQRLIDDGFAVGHAHRQWKCLPLGIDLLEFPLDPSRPPEDPYALPVRVVTFCFLRVASSCFRLTTFSAGMDACRIGWPAPRGKTSGSPPTWFEGEIAVPKYVFVLAKTPAKA